MNTATLDWTELQSRCDRIGWGLGWLVGLTVAAIGLAGGSDYYLTMARSVLGLVGLVLLGRGTGVLLTKLVPTDSDEETTDDEEADLGKHVDLSVGDDEEATPGMESEHTQELVQSGNPA